MYVGFRTFLGALVVVGMSLGASFGLGVAFGEKPEPAVVASAAGGGAGGAAGGAAAATRGGGPTGGGGVAAGAAFGGGGAGFGGGGGQVVSGTVESATPTSVVVKSADGTMVTLVLTELTVIRKTDTGTAADLAAGVQVFATRDGASNAATVSIVPPGTTLPGSGGGQRGGGAGGGGVAPGARGTATP